MDGRPATARGSSTGAALEPKPWPHSSALPQVKTCPSRSAAEECRPPPSQQAPFSPGRGRRVRTAMLAKPRPTWPSPFSPAPWTAPSAPSTKVHSAAAKTPFAGPATPLKSTSWGSSSACRSGLGTSRSGTSRTNAVAPEEMACWTLGTERAAALRSLPEASRTLTTCLPSTWAPPPSRGCKDSGAEPPGGISTTTSSKPQPDPLARPSCPVAFEPHA
mmetsp:Transcript_66260/g.207577  ORF Transcript_66260/g.207577 Transcript_66260/m.207577 type:complete len:218 (+) Transcript_66260:540-1193(+)